MVIPAIWDVFWDQTDLLRTLVRPPNTLSQKRSKSEEKKFGDFGLFLPLLRKALQEAITKQKAKYPQVKKLIRM